jgi:cytidine deaminase
MSAMPISTKELEQLKKAALQASKNAYCPYSRFPVGAAILNEAGKIASGCNVENASYGLTICAERNAIFQSIASYGQHHIKAVVVYTPRAKPSAPCGACRQVIKEFGPNAEVYSYCDGKEVLRMEISELLPNSFNSQDIEKAQT